MAQRVRRVPLRRIGQRGNYNDASALQRRRARDVARLYQRRLNRQEMGDREGDDMDDEGPPRVVPVLNFNNMPRAVRGGGGNVGGNPPGPMPPFNGPLGRGIVPGVNPIPLVFDTGFNLRGRNAVRNTTIGNRRRRKRFSGFSRRSFKFLRWLYHNRKKKRFTEAQQQNALARRQVFFRAWEIARGQGRRYLTGADVRAAQGGYSARAPGAFSSTNSFV